MWKEFTQDGFLKYPNFLETVTQLKPMYFARMLGGVLYISGVVLGVYNLVMTVKAGKFLPEEAASAPALEPVAGKRAAGESGHRWLERKPIQFAVFALIVILIGGIIEIVPLYLVKTNIPSIASVKPYTPLELQGRDIYVREGCYTCHSQMVRPFRSETERYGEYAKAGEYVYDRSGYRLIDNLPPAFPLGLLHSGWIMSLLYLLIEWYKLSSQQVIHIRWV